MLTPVPKSLYLTVIKNMQRCFKCRFVSTTHDTVYRFQFQQARLSDRTLISTFSHSVSSKGHQTSTTARFIIYNLLMIYTHLQCKTKQQHLLQKIHIYETSLTTLVSIAATCCTNSNSYYERHNRKTLRYDTCSHHVLRHPNFALPKAPQAIRQGAECQQTTWNWNGITFYSTQLHTSNEPWYLSRYDVINSKSWNCLLFRLCPSSHV
jgi:hypothetical protein